MIEQPLLVREADVVASGASSFVAASIAVLSVVISLISSQFILSAEDKITAKI